MKSQKSIKEFILQGFRHAWGSIKPMASGATGEINNYEYDYSNKIDTFRLKKFLRIVTQWF